MAAARPEVREGEKNGSSRRRPGATEMEDERKSKRMKLQVVLNSADSNLDFNVSENGLAGSALFENGFGYCWSGARANLGILAGRYCFGCKITGIQKVDMPDTAADQKNLCRLGISRGDSDVGCLGESKHSFGFGGTGKFSTGGIFKDYGGKFGVGDTIVCAVDLESQPLARISFSKNGISLGTASEFDAGPTGVGVTEPVFGQGLPWSRALFPHVLLKNVTVQMQFSASDGLVPMQGFRAWDAAVDDGLAMEGPRIGSKADCEILMMVGLPASGKTTWCEHWNQDHPDKRYVIIGTNLALDQMKVPGLLRKHNYAQRWEQLMSRATEIFNTLLDRAASTPRNYIIDQTNVYLSARKRKLRPFSGFRKIAVVVVVKSEEHARRTKARAKELGKEVPVEAVNEMKANFVLPKSKDMLMSEEPFDEVWFVETQRQEAETIVQRDKAALPKAGHPQGISNGSKRVPLLGSTGSQETWPNAPAHLWRGNLPSLGYGQSLLGSPNLQASRGELLGQGVDPIGPRGELNKSRGVFVDGRGDFVGQRGELIGLGGELLEPRGDVYGPGGELVRQRADFMGPTGEPLIPRSLGFCEKGELIGQGGELMGQRVNLDGQRRELVGQRVLSSQGDDGSGRIGDIGRQRGELIGQSGVRIVGPRGELTDPSGELIGGRELIGQKQFGGGDLTGQRGGLLGQQGMHMHRATGLPVSAYNALNTLNFSGYDAINPTTGLSRSGYESINPATGMPISGFDLGNVGWEGPRSAYDGPNPLTLLQETPYNLANQASGIPRSTYDILSSSGGIPLGAYGGFCSGGGLSTSLYDAFNPNGLSQSISAGAGAGYGGATFPLAQSPGLTAPLLPLPTQNPSHQHFF